METPCRRIAPQQDFGTKRSAHILDTHKPMADARVPRQRLAFLPCLPPSVDDVVPSRPGRAQRSHPSSRSTIYPRETSHSVIRRVHVLMRVP
jgi:hypothetical protein